MAKLVDQARLAQLAQALDSRMKAAVAAEKSRAEGIETGLDTRIQANADAIAAINNVENGLLKQAKDYADGKDAAIAAKVAQADYNAKMKLLDDKDAEHSEDIQGLISQVEALENTVKNDDGITLPSVDKAINDFKEEQEAKDQEQDGKIAALEAKFEGAQSVDNKIAAAQAAAEAKAAELDGALKTELQGKIDAKVAQADYDTKVQALEGADNALDGRLDVIEGEGEGSIKKAVADEAAIARAAEKANADAIKAEKERAEGAEGALAGRLDVIEGTGEGSIKKAVADLVNQAPEDMNTLKELSDAIAAHGNEFTAYITTVNGQIATAKSEAIADAANKDDALKALLQAEIDSDVAAEAGLREAADTALENKLQAEIDKKVDKVEGKSLVDNAEIARLAEVDNYDDTEVRGLINGIDAAYKAADVTINAAIANKVDKVESSRLVAETEIAAFEAKAEVSQVNQALADAKDYADDQDAALKSAIETAQAAIDEEQDRRIGVVEAMVGAGGGEGNKNAIEQLQDDVADNTAAIAKLNGGAEVDGSVAKAVKAEETRAMGIEEGLAGRIKALEDDKPLKEQAIQAAQNAADQAQDEVDALETVVANNKKACEDAMTQEVTDRNNAIATIVGKLGLEAGEDNKLQLTLDGAELSYVAVQDILAQIEVVSEADITEIINGLNE